MSSRYVRRLCHRKTLDITKPGTRPDLPAISDSIQSQRALPYATTLAAAGHGRLVLLQAIGDPDLCTRAEAVLARIAEDLAGQPFDVETVVEPGDAGRVIVDCTGKTAADLIAIATDRWSDVDRWLNGSVADWVLRHTRVPILLVGPECAAGPSSGADHPRVLVPLDESALAQEVLDPAVAVARLLHAEVLLLRVIDGDASRSIAQAYLASVAARLSTAGLHITTQVASGDAETTIERTAREAGASLIAMATHGRTGLARLVLGSVATRTLQHATVPLLLVRPVPVQEPPESAPKRPPFLFVG